VTNITVTDKIETQLVWRRKTVALINLFLAFIQPSNYELYSNNSLSLRDLKSLKFAHHSKLQWKNTQDAALEESGLHT